MGECYLHTVEVTGSNPVPPTKIIKGLRYMPQPLFVSDPVFSWRRNSETFHAMKTEKRLKGFEERLGKIEEKEKSHKEKESRIRKGDNDAEKDTILKKRMVCVG
ncbi:MAG: hypothetical protein SRB2_02460 [Desulfobacteraceae bacterium Eth-SRB2]|nr:MAG: hypothetical protein SRB2_02460 [Desulfobacteraceae bacterium Eth-SRB2]